VYYINIASLPRLIFVQRQVVPGDEGVPPREITVHWHGNTMLALQPAARDDNPSAVIRAADSRRSPQIPGLRMFSCVNPRNAYSGNIAG